MSFSWSFSPNGVPILMSATVTASETGGALATTLAWFRGALLLAPIPFEFGGVELPSVLDADSQLAVHTDARCCSGVRQCYCTECVELRNPETTLVKSSRSDAPKGFEELHKVIGSELREAIGSNFYDDILFLLNRIHDLSPNAFDEIPDLATARALSSSNTSRPLEKIETSKDPAHWFAFYWRNKNKAVPAGEHFREQLSTELEKVEFNHDLPSGGTRSYAFDSDHRPASVLTLHSTDPRFDGLPWAIDDESVTFAEEIASPIPDKWVPSQDRHNTKWTAPSDGKKYVFTIVRCKVCGALDEQKYAVFNPLGSRKTKVCHIDEKYLCDRESCIKSRQFKQNFDRRRLLAGYPSHRYYAPPVRLDLWSWIRSDERNVNDPNLTCELRYVLDTRGRKGILPKFKDDENEIGNVALPSHVHTDETIAHTDKTRDGQVINNWSIKNAETNFHITSGLTKIENYEVAVEPDQHNVTPVGFDKNIHRIVGESFEESRHIPNYNCFGPIVRSVDPDPESDVVAVAALDSFEVRDFGVSRTGIWISDPKGYGLLHPLGKTFIIQGTAPYYIPEYRDPEVSKILELNTYKQLKKEFKEWCIEQNAKDDTGGWVWARSGRRWIRHKGWRWYSNPNTLDKSSIITTLRDTHGGEEEIRQKQLKKLEEKKKQGPLLQYIEDFYLGKSRKHIAEEQKISVPTSTKRHQRFLNTPVVTEDSQWAKAISRSKCERDGVYAAASLGGHTQAYLILPLTEFTESFENNLALLEDSLHHTICDILERRVKNGRVKNESDLKPMYREVYEEFCRFGWRKLWRGKWYQEDQTEVPVLSTT